MVAEIRTGVSFAVGDQQEKDMNKVPEVMERFSILTGMQVTQEYTFIKTH